MHAMDALDNGRRSGDQASNLPKDITEQFKTKLAQLIVRRNAAYFALEYFIARLEAVLDNKAVGLPNVQKSTYSEVLRKNLLQIEGALHQDAVRRATSDKND